MPKKIYTRSLLYLLAGNLVLALIGSACSRLSPPVDSLASQTIPTAVSVALTGTASARPLPSNTPTAIETTAAPAPTTAAPTSTAWPTATSTLTLTPTPVLHPMSITGLRRASFPGSDIALVERLDSGVNYSRFYASYESEGLTIYGLLTIPESEMPPGGFPAIVFNHGYIPPEVYRTTERYIAYVDWLARSGYVVFRIDYRGHDRSEGEPTGAYGDPGYTVDVLNAVASLKRFPYVNAERIGMWGHSMGGFLTLRAMVVSPDIRAGVIWAGVVGSYPDLLTRWRRRGAETSTPVPSSGSRRWRDSWAAEYGTPDDNPDFWNDISANAYLAEISGPIQLHHGTSDDSVPHELSEILYEQMLAAGKPVELYIYEGDNHNLTDSFSDAMTRTLQFFAEYLKAGL